MSDRPVLKMSALDRGIAALSPQWALHRMAAKSRLLQFGYNDDPTLRGQAKPISQTGGETYAKQRDRFKMMADAREQAEFTWIGGCLGKIVNYVVGELVCKSSTGEPELDRLYDKYLHDWAGDQEDADGFPACDATGRHRLIKLCQIGLGAMMVDGDHGLQWLPGDEQKMPSLLSVDADRIGSPQEAVQAETYIGGIGIEPSVGRIQFYRVFKRTRLAQYIDPVEIPPSNFFHLWDTERGDEYRGRSHLKRALNILRDMHETELAESVAIKTQSQWAAMIGSKDPWTDKGVAAWNGKTAAGTPTQDAGWGKILRMQEGETVTGFQPTARPTGSFMQFEDHRIRQVAAGLKFSYGFVWNMAELGGATARVEVKGDARQIAYLRRIVLVDKFLRRMRKLLLAHGVAYGHIPPHPAMDQCKWHFGTDVVVDAGYEVANDLQLLNAGLTDPDTLAVKYNNGENFEGVQRHIAGAFNTTRSIATETGTTVELLARSLWPDATAQIAARETPPEELLPPPPGSMQAVGEKGAQQITDLLIAVSEGRMDAESAVQTLVTVYGLTQEQAEAIVPDGPTPLAKRQSMNGSARNGHGPKKETAASRN